MPTCPNCGSDQLHVLSSTKQYACSECLTFFPMEQDETKPPLIGNNRQKSSLQ